MSRGLSNIVEVVMSLLVECGGAGVRGGGGGLLLGAARKIGWAGKARGRSGRIGGHSLGGHQMGMGFAGRGGLHNYDPKTYYKQMQSAEYSRGAWSGSGLVSGPRRETRPTGLHGRSVFLGSTTLSGEPTNRWVRGGRHGGGGGYAPRPRSFIRFG